MPIDASTRWRLWSFASVGDQPERDAVARRRRSSTSALTSPIRPTRSPSVRSFGGARAAHRAAAFELRAVVAELALVRQDPVGARLRGQRELAGRSETSAHSRGPSRRRRPTARTPESSTCASDRSSSRSARSGAARAASLGAASFVHVSSNDDERHARLLRRTRRTSAAGPCRRPPTSR